MSEGDFSGERGSSRLWIEAGQEGGLPGAREEYGGSSSRGAPADLGFSPNEQRVKDLVLLHALCDDTLSPFGGGLKDAERQAFEDMRDALEAPVRKYETLSPKQREWATRRADEMSLDLRTPAERNADVPRGHEVESRAAQLGLPLAPPGRTAGKGLDALFEPGPFEREAGAPREPERSSMGYGPRRGATIVDLPEREPDTISTRPSAGARRRPRPIGGAK